MSGRGRCEDDMRFCIETLGCKVNQYETQAIETILTERGHVSGAAGDGCDVCIVNTCAVTNESGRKSRQAVRRMKNLEPNAFIAVCGCFSQISPEEVRALGADIVAGSGDRRAFVDDIERLVKSSYASRDVGDPFTRKIFEELPSGGVSGRTRGMLKIQDGCDNFCAYCIIPYARGPARSLPVDKAVAEAIRLEQAGYRELVVTGIEISSYGKDLGDKTALVDAVCAVSHGVPNMRLRLGSLEPGIVTEEFVRALKEMPNICDHFHLSLQSGCDDTLKRMGRKYDTGRFLQSVETLRQYFPACGITADLIVGFPVESDAEFGKTLEFIQKCNFSSMHIFPYSRRPGTAAADMSGQVEKGVKRERARIAGAVAQEMEISFLRSCTGSVQNVLFEREASGISSGHAGNYAQVCVNAVNIHNTMLTVQITEEKNGVLWGKVTSPII